MTKANITKSKNNSALAALSASLHPVIAEAGDRVRLAFLEFFTVSISNANTRITYYAALNTFFDYLELHQFSLLSLQALMIAGFREELLNIGLSPATQNLHLAAVKTFLNYLLMKGLVETNAALPVRRQRVSSTVGKTPVILGDVLRGFFDSMRDETCLIDIRDRAICGLMLMTFVRVNAATSARVKDFFFDGQSWMFRCTEKGTKERLIPVNPEAANWINLWIDRAGIRNFPDGYLFRAMPRRGGVTDNKLLNKNVYQMVKRRGRALGLNICCHSFRASGITTYLINGGDLPTAQEVAGHESIDTTRMYDRRPERLARDLHKVRVY